MSWESHRDIERLLYLYAKYVDAAQWGDLGRLFNHAEVRTSTGGDDVIRGREAVVDQWSSLNKVHDDGTLRTRHLLTNVMIDIDESAGTASSESYFMSFQATDRMPLQPIVGGRYRDRFRRIDGAWAFVERFIQVDQIGDVSDNLNMVLEGPAMSAILDWYGCATFRLTLDDLVVFLDAYIDRVPGAPGTGLRADDVDRADWIVVGHSHFDHLWGAERIARQTGATIIGSYETVRVMIDAGVPADQLMPVSGGERIRLSDDVTVSVFPSLHSCVWTHKAMGQSDQVCLGDLGRDPPGAPGAGQGAHRGALPPWTKTVKAHVSAGNQGVRGDGGALVYLFETPDGTLLYQDTSGPLERHRPRTASRCRHPGRGRAGQRRRRTDPGHRSPSLWPGKRRCCGPAG